MNYICQVLDYMAWFWFMEWLILVYIINRIIHGRLEIWNLSSRVHIRYVTRSLRSLVRYRCEHSKINSISPRDHGRGMTSVCLAYDGDISLKIRIKPPNNYLSVELNKQSQKSYSGFYCIKKMLTLNAISNSGATLETRKTWTEFTFARTVTRPGQGKKLANS